MVQIVEVKRSERPLKLVVFSVIIVVFLLVVLGCLGELLFRIALFSDYFQVSQLRQPWRYADANLDDDSWKLAYIFSTGKKAHAQTVGQRDSKLGWVPEVTKDNPLGLISDTPYNLDNLKGSILFYGDSFVQGATPVNKAVPQSLDLLIPERSVLNYGVGGYGLDQIHMRFKSTVMMFPDARAIIGILTNDLDRAVLGFRTAQKPYYRIDEGKLAIRNIPITMDSVEYVEQNPPSIRSYLFRFVLFKLRALLPELWFDALLGYDAKKSLKVQINRRLIQDFKEVAERLDMPICVVVFYSESELQRVSFNEKFLVSTLQEVGMPYINTKKLLLNYVRENGGSISDLYYQDNGHPNVLGNRVIAQGIKFWLETNWTD